MEAERFIKSRYNPMMGDVSRHKDLLAFLYHLQNLGVESYNIKASSPTDAMIVLETKSKTRKIISLKIENNSPYMIKNLQEIQLNLSEILLRISRIYAGFTV